jgi:DNA invertase Pin-like site-specific DNA recombinase
MKSIEAGKIIEERIEKLKKDGVSEREIERKTKVSRQTIGRKNIL